MAVAITDCCLLDIQEKAKFGVLIVVYTWIWDGWQNCNWSESSAGKEIVYFVSSEHFQISNRKQNDTRL